MENWQISGIVVFAVLVGAAIPVLVQLAIALRSLRASLAKTTVRLDRALEAVTQVAGRFDRIAAGVDEARVRSVMEAADSLARMLNQLRESVRVASAVGAAVAPAVGAAVRAWRSGPQGDGAAENPSSEVVEKGEVR